MGWRLGQISNLLSLPGKRMCGFPIEHIATVNVWFRCIEKLRWKFSIFDLYRCRHVRTALGRCMFTPSLGCCFCLGRLRGVEPQRRVFVRRACTEKIVTHSPCETSLEMGSAILPPLLVAGSTKRRSTLDKSECDWHIPEKAYLVNTLRDGEFNYKAYGTKRQGGNVLRRPRRHRLVGEAHVIAESVQWLQRTKEITPAEIGPWVRSVHNLFLLTE